MTTPVQSAFPYSPVPLESPLGYLGVPRQWDPLHAAGSAVSRWVQSSPRFLKFDRETFAKNVADVNDLLINNPKVLEAVRAAPDGTLTGLNPGGVDLGWLARGRQAAVETNISKMLLDAERRRLDAGNRYGTLAANTLGAAAVVLPLALMLNAYKLKAYRRRKQEEEELLPPQLQVKAGALRKAAADPDITPPAAAPEHPAAPADPAQVHPRVLADSPATAQLEAQVPGTRRLVQDIAGATMRGAASPQPEAFSMERLVPGYRFFTTPKNEGDAMSQDARTMLFNTLAPVAAAYGTYKLVDWVTDRMRERQLEARRRKLQEEYTRLLSTGLAKRSCLEKALDAAAAEFEKAAATDIVSLLKNIGWLVAGTSALAGGYLGYTHGAKTNENRMKRKALRAAMQRMQLQRAPVVSVLPGSSRRGAGYRVTSRGFAAPSEISVPMPLFDEGPSGGDEEDAEKKKSLLTFPT